ncbi:cupin domain protein [Fusarium beomiforme]|uniref:Cupin domain protein n=1 Tax=Fusarium beomiforme TaxID=44412 RepID=A0A9P5AL99_9HYPO|nr:cupin domain protein [Fusarium beomiforme]
MAVLGPTIGEISKNYDVIFRPDFVGAEVGEWTEHDTKIPEGMKAYYLKADTGPRYLLGSILSRPFITIAQNNGQFSITSIESSSILGGNVLKHGLSFKRVHQVYCVLDEMILVTVDGHVGQVEVGEIIFIPSGMYVTVRFQSKYVTFWSYGSGDGLEKLIEEAGGLLRVLLYLMRPGK